MRPLARPAAVVLVSLLVSIGCEPELELRLLGAGFEDAYDGVQQLSVAVLDADFVPLQTYAAPTLEPAELGLAPAGEGRRIRVVGIGGQGKPVAHGYSSLLDFGRGTPDEALVPFGALLTAVAVPIEHAVAGEPEIDGVLNEWIAPPSLLLDDGFRVSGPSRPDIRAELLVGWGYDRLLFAVRVVDRCRVRQQTTGGSCAPLERPGRIVLGFDGIDAGGETVGRGAFVVIVSTEGIQLLAGEVDNEGLSMGISERSDGSGWSLEGSVSLRTLAREAIAQRDRIGIELAVEIDNAAGGEPTVLRLSGLQAAPETVVAPEAMATLGFGSR